MALPPCPLCEAIRLMVKNGCRTLVFVHGAADGGQKGNYSLSWLLVCLCHICLFLSAMQSIGHRYLDVKRLASVHFNKLYLYDTAPILLVTSLCTLCVRVCSACIVYQSADDTALSSKPCFSICHIRQKPPPSFDLSLIHISEPTRPY